jgi:hypothetical protein
MDFGVDLTSIVVATVFSGLLNGFYNTYIRERNYVSDYHKLILTRRLAAYEALEKLIVDFKGSILLTYQTP